MPLSSVLRLRFRPSRRATRAPASYWSELSDAEVLRRLAALANPRHRAIRRLVSRTTGVRSVDELTAAEWLTNELSTARVAPAMIRGLADAVRRTGALSRRDAADIRARLADVSLTDSRCA